MAGYYSLTFLLNLKVLSKIVAYDILVFIIFFFGKKTTGHFSSIIIYMCVGVCGCILYSPVRRLKASISTATTMYLFKGNGYIFRGCNY